MVNQEQLIERLNKGDIHAFITIYQSFANGMYDYAYSKIGEKEPSEDIVQEIFVRLWERRQSFAVRKPLGAYLMELCKVYVLQYMRAVGVRDKYAVEFILHVAELDHQTADVFANLGDISLLIEQTLKTLNPKCQQAFRLSRQEHLTIDEIAIKMRISRRTVENYLSQALRALRISLGDFLALLALFLWY